MSDNLPSITRTIGKHKYKCTMLTLDKWLRFEGLAVSTLGGPLEKFVSSMPSAISEVLDMDTKDIAMSLKGVLSALGPEQIEEFLEAVGKCVQVKGGDEDGWTYLKMNHQQIWWARNMREMIPVLVLMLEVQLKDFFLGVLDLAPSLRELEKSQKPSPSLTE